MGHTSKIVGRNGKDPDRVNHDQAQGKQVEEAYQSQVCGEGEGQEEMFDAPQVLCGL